MDAATLKRAMQETYVSDAKFAEYLPYFQEAMIVAGCTTIRRAAAWCAQVGHESAGLRYFRELDTWETPQWTYDRERYRGRGPIQLTWKSNYQAFGNWCKSRGLVDDANLFVNRPELVEQPKWGFLAASFYWVAQRPAINSYADAGNFGAITYAINGGYNGADDRNSRYARCLDLGAALLPEEDFMANVNDAEKGDILRGVRQWSGPSRGVRQVSVRLRQFVGKSFSDFDKDGNPNGVWPRDELDALVNEIVWDGYDITEPAFGKSLLDMPDTEKLNVVTLVRVIGARIQAMRAQNNRIEAKLDQLLERLGK